SIIYMNFRGIFWGHRALKIYDKLHLKSYMIIKIQMTNSVRPTIIKPAATIYEHSVFPNINPIFERYGISGRNEVTPTFSPISFHNENVAVAIRIPIVSKFTHLGVLNGRGICNSIV